VHAKRLDKTPAASVCDDPGVSKAILLDHLARGRQERRAHDGNQAGVLGLYPSGDGI
jgi:hypothetical protein